MKTFYKFYAADSSHIRDVFRDSSLFMTNFIEMRSPNDSSEGIYWLDASTSDSLREKVLHEKKNLMICCVTNKIKNAHMWHEFAKDGNGICLAIRLNATDIIKPFKVSYVNARPYITAKQFKNQSPEKIAEIILKHKLASYSDELETRILRRVSDGRIKDSLRVRIVRLYLGWNLAEDKEREFRGYAADANAKVIKLHKPIV